jgi:hypothetical protein
VAGLKKKKKKKQTKQLSLAPVYDYLMSFGIDHILEGSQEAAEWLSSTLHTEGYAVLKVRVASRTTLNPPTTYLRILLKQNKVSDQYRRLFDSLASETKNFFASISAGSLRAVWCLRHSADTALNRGKRRTLL